MRLRQRDIADFQPDGRAIDERPLPAAARATVHVIVAAIALGIGWAALFEVDRVVVAEGRLISTTPSIVLQPLETGVIRELPASVGQRVRAGDRLATLDPTFAAADLNSLRDRATGLAAEVERLRREVAGEPYAPTGASPAERYQAVLAEQRAGELRFRLSSLDAQEARLRVSLAAATEAQGILRDRLTLAGQLQDIRDELRRRTVGSQLQVIEAQLNRLSLQEQLAAKQGEALELGHRLDEVGFERETIRHEWSRQAQERLIAATREHDAVSQELAKAERRSDLVDLRAPRDGVVLDIAQRTVGSVARAAEPLITLVPTPAEVEAEVEIAPTDIARVRTGGIARVKLDALPFQRHGVLEGTVRVISEDAFHATAPPSSGNDTGRERTVFRARIALAPPALRDVPPDFRLIPGMTVRAEIAAGRRSVLSYLAYPLLRGLDESLREP